MNLSLKKPIVFFDLETTGIQISSDRIVEISILKIFPNGNKESKTWLVNPEIEISKEASDIHGITNEQVVTEPLFSELAPKISQMIEGCDLAGFNSNRFDIPLLAEEMLRANINFDMIDRLAIDVQVIFHKKEQRTLGAGYKFYCDKDLENAHSAEADTLATFEILEAQIEKYEDVENDMEFLAKFSERTKNVDLLGRLVYDKNDTPVFNFGKHKGKSVEEVYNREPGYYSWMMNGDFPLYTKKVLSEIVEQIKLNKTAQKSMNFDNKLDQLQNKFKK